MPRRHVRIHGIDLTIARVTNRADTLIARRIPSPELNDAGRLPRHAVAFSKTPGYLSRRDHLRTCCTEARLQVSDEILVGEQAGDVIAERTPQQRHAGGVDAADEVVGVLTGPAARV